MRRALLPRPETWIRTRHYALLRGFEPPPLNALASQLLLAGLIFLGTAHAPM